jgi:hypothetical protein
MSNPSAALAALVERVATADADGSLASERAVQLRAVEPLLEILGWDVRGSEVTPAADVAGLAVDYLLSVDEVPGILVVTTGPTDDLQAEGIAGLERGIHDGHAARGIATDGTTVVLLAEHDGEVHHRSFPFTELPEHAQALGQFHRSVVARSISEERADRAAAARRLAENRDDLADSIAEAILDVADEPVGDDVLAEAERTVDALVEDFREDDVSAMDRERSIADDPDGRSGAGAVATEPEPASAGSDPEAQGSSDPVTAGEDDTEAVPETATAPEGEYVVRFFGGSSSVGAVGTETPSGTTVGTVRYLLENHALHSSITLPWRDGDGTVVLAEEAGGDGWTTLSNAAGDSISVRRIENPATARRVIDDLVEAADLRAMFQGDW